MMKENIPKKPAKIERISVMQKRCCSMISGLKARGRAGRQLMFAGGAGQVWIGLKRSNKP
jgi:hypothetical protein